MVGGQLPPGVGDGVGVGVPPSEPSMATVIRSLGIATPLGPLAATASSTSPNATAEVRSVFGVAVIVTSCVSPRPPVKLKLDGWTSIVNPGVIALPVAVQLVGDAIVLRTVRVQVQLGVHSMLRTDGTFKVLGSPPALGFASMKCCVVSSITKPARAALVRSTRPVPTSSASQGVVPSSLVPPLNEHIIRTDFYSATGQSLCLVRSNAVVTALTG